MSVMWPRAPTQVEPIVASHSLLDGPREMKEGCERALVSQGQKGKESCVPRHQEEGGDGGTALRSARLQLCALTLRWH